MRAARAFLNRVEKSPIYIPDLFNQNPGIWKDARHEDTT